MAASTHSPHGCGRTFHGVHGHASRIDYALVPDGLLPQVSKVQVRYRSAYRLQLSPPSRPLLFGCGFHVRDALCPQGHTQHCRDFSPNRFTFSHLSPSCLPLVFQYTLDASEWSLVSHWSPTTLWILCPHDFKLASHLSPTGLPIHSGYSECFGPNDFALVSPSCLHYTLDLCPCDFSICLELTPSTFWMLWALWSAWLRTCLPLASQYTLRARMILRLSPTYPSTPCALHRMILRLFPPVCTSPPSPSAMGTTTTNHHLQPLPAQTSNTMKFFRLIYKQTVWGQRWYNSKLASAVAGLSVKEQFLRAVDAWILACHNSRLGRSGSQLFGSASTPLFATLHGAFSNSIAHLIDANPKTLQMRRKWHWQAGCAIGLWFWLFRCCLQPYNYTCITCGFGKLMFIFCSCKGGPKL